MPQYEFLSDEWIAATRQLRSDYKAELNPPPMSKLKLNQNVTGVPFGNGTLEAHLDTSGGEPEIELGHLPDAEITVTVDYQLAKKVFVEGNVGAAMEGLQLGRISVEGDMMKLMALAGMSADAGSIELTKKIREITA